MRIGQRELACECWGPGLTGWQTPFNLTSALARGWVVVRMPYGTPNISPEQIAQLTSSEEQGRAAEMLPESGGEVFLQCRARLRLLLAECLVASSPQNIEIVRDSYGKPYLPASPGLHFNLSHSHGMLVIALAKQQIGVDIEALREVPDWQNLATGILTRHELDAITSLPQREQSAAFLRRFTAREAVLKALGTGFAGTAPVAEIHSTPESLSQAPGSAFLVPLPEMQGHTGHVCQLQEYIQ